MYVCISTQDAIYIDWQEQLRIVASLVREAVIFLSGARADCLYNSSLLIYQLPSPPRRQNPLQPAGQAKPPSCLSNVYRYLCPHHLSDKTLSSQQGRAEPRAQYPLSVLSDQYFGNGHR